jgi:2-polyprenyl-3-methyl-5-hydroxy-6-metoxy-1,4-benzoquinol methylase
MDAITKKEQEKYETVWTEIPAYGNYSPAMQIVGKAIDLCKEMKAKTLLDAGCGVGRATAAFIDAGLTAVGVDITLKAVDHEIHEKYMGNFIQSSLWELPVDWPPFDCVFCVDVMEHIPPERICMTLANLRRVLRGFALFNIALFKDGFGKSIGTPLHLSLFPVNEWEEMLKEHFPDTKRLEESVSYVTFICKV